MGSYASLTANKVELQWYKNVVPQEILALFRDADLTTTLEHNPERLNVSEQHIVFKSTIGDVKDRLAVFGFTDRVVRMKLEEALEDRASLNASFREEYPDLVDSSNATALLQSLDGWLSALHNQPNCVERQMQWREDAYVDEIFYELGHRAALGASLLGLPSEACLVLDLTSLYLGGWLPEDLTSMASQALKEVQLRTTTDAPLVVLTEGRTDAQLLSLGLEVLFPHLVDVVRFADFSQKPEGGAGALVKTIRAFAAAGVANRVIALFDNDSSAWEARKPLALSSMPPNIIISNYPDIKLAEDYPTIDLSDGPQSTSISRSENVNGRAGSIELYLGRSALTTIDGELRPIQWKSHLDGIGRLQGEVIEKRLVQQSYRQRAQKILSGDLPADADDWKEMNEILIFVIRAFTDA